MENTIKVSGVDMKARKALGIRAGDTVRVSQKIEEKGKTRLQAFEGLVLARKHGSQPGGTFTVRRVASGVGVEKIFPLYSPMIDKIEIVKRARVRRAKLYYIRDKVSREARRILRRTRLMGTTSADLEKGPALRSLDEVGEEVAPMESPVEVEVEHAIAEVAAEQTEQGFLPNHAP